MTDPGFGSGFDPDTLGTSADTGHTAAVLVVGKVHIDFALD